MLRLGILISGRGSNMQALIDACSDKGFPATVKLVISNVPDAKGLAIASDFSIPTLTINHRDFGKDRQAFEDHLDRALRDANVDMVCLAGFMRVLTPWFIERWHNKLMNIHPSLLPAFPGLDTHKRALEAGVVWHGATVHFVRAQVDAGPILAQGVLQVEAMDDEVRLSSKVLKLEHRLYPMVIEKLAKGLIKIEEDRIISPCGLTL